jgi:hypothetical protein
MSAAGRGMGGGFISFFAMVSAGNKHGDGSRLKHSGRWSSASGDAVGHG